MTFHLAYLCERRIFCVQVGMSERDYTEARWDTYSSFADEFRDVIADGQGELFTCDKLTIALQGDVSPRHVRIARPL